MTDKSRKQKLERVLGLYEQELESLKARSAKQSQIVNSLEGELGDLASELSATYEQAPSHISSFVHQQMAGLSAQATQIKIIAKQTQLSEAQSVFRQTQDEVLVQMSKIDSIKKLIEQKKKELEKQFRLYEQISLDERFLSQYTAGPIE